MTKKSVTRAIREFAIARALKWGVRVSPTTRKETLTSFFRDLKPVGTNHELVRIGGDGDGGYLVPNDLEGISTCFSPGVSEVATFESHLATQGIKSFLADYSVDGSPVDNDMFDFEKKYLGAFNDDQYMTLESWVNNKAPNETDFILQMDIEGAEYPVLCDASREVLNRFRIIVIEFHNLDSVFERFAFGYIHLAFQKLLRDFEIVHMHPNNCAPLAKYRGFTIPPVLEVSFLRKDRITSKHNVGPLPHPLDVTNFSDQDDVELPIQWRGT